MSVTLLIADLNDEQHQQDLLMLLESYANDPMGGDAPLSQYTKDHLIAAMQHNPSVLSILCYVDNKPAGICNCVQGFSTFKAKPLLNIHDLAVLPEYRGMKLSHQMLAFAEQVAKDKGCCKLTLEVLEGNSVAKASYIKFGFNGYELDPKLGKAEFWEKAL
ncbi:GNAT family N-acetyltransferase [Thalassotalea maritima]|uniref:GNAT family N-acetyltransferase n=1 Tax=Thalassotalea maritima TaxID=3242416 RepID=UPI0035280BF6